MLAYFSAASRSSHDSLPVCLHEENPNRLVSLWDAMNEFKAADLCLRVGNFSIFESIFATTQSSAPDWNKLKIDFISQVVLASKDCEAAGMRDAVDLFNRIQDNLLGHPHEPPAWCIEAKHARGQIVDELRKARFLHVIPDRCEYLEQESLFGAEVNDKFPSATRDIKEAGNCLAAECGTGSVFHLMRAAEFALHSLARDRDVEFKDRPLGDKQWGEILGALEGKLTGLRNSDRKNWVLPEIRDAQIRFYNEVVQELRGFNDAWRRHTSHADVLAFYERDAALDILKHVRTFMHKLALKMISEHSVTPLYWTA